MIRSFRKSRIVHPMRKPASVKITLPEIKPQLDLTSVKEKPEIAVAIPVVSRAEEMQSVKSPDFHKYKLTIQ